MPRFELEEKIISGWDFIRKKSFNFIENPWVRGNRLVLPRTIESIFSR